MTTMKHRICERCWFDVTLVRDTRPQGVMEDGLLRLPVRVKDSDPAPCCVCGRMSVSGIFFRRHPEDLLCRDRHDDYTSWSSVAPSGSLT